MSAIHSRFGHRTLLCDWLGRITGHPTFQYFTCPVCSLIGGQPGISPSRLPVTLFPIKRIGVSKFNEVLKHEERGEESRILPLATGISLAYCKGLRVTGHSAFTAVAFAPVESNRITPEASEQKLRCPVVPVVTGLAVTT